ncbi:hypothetical protein N0V83_000310 [Neocucurbitaria cava]|uniref:Uncharacterized protein n=1 Tax=Neocucurbitaria cava TaxID=798079 RepID=A0A9W8YG54_9PLEO|nr:hypothetical protein N0V83_000310 [Neocucurbitaria cava]
MTTSYTAHRAALLSTTFWEVLPSHYDKIQNRRSKIARLYDEAKSELLATDREVAMNSLKAELEMLDNDVNEYRNVTKGVDITDIAGMYVTAGKSPHRALQVAKEDFENLEINLRMIEERIAELKADIVYGLGEKK